jgi:peptide-methionine (S)-S-oxide reductase
MEKSIVLAGGCFWGMQGYFDLIDGVFFTRVGYANGTQANPTYEQVCTGTTGHAEALWVEYETDMLPLNHLLAHYWRVIDPTTQDRQGADTGSQYRTGIYYTDADDLPTILASLEKEKQKYKKPIVTQIEELRCFYDAENYHQQYLEKNPGGYCHIHVSPEGWNPGDA